MTHWKSGLLAALVVGLVAGGTFTFTLSQPAQAEAEKGKGSVSGLRYSVVETEAKHLIVTDNQTNILYFYAIDPEAKVGDDLKLRGSLDLNQVGKAVLRPVKAKQ